MEASTLAPATALRRARAATAGVRLQLGAIVSLSFLVHGLASRGHTTPRTFPDEYIYASLGRSLGLHGALAIRGAPAHFPAVLAPLAAAPIWALSSVTTGYRLVQLENGLFFSLGAVPAYLLARRLRLSHRYALLCAIFAVAIPGLLRSAFVMAGSLAYPLALFALWAGLAALERPSPRRELAFLGLAGLACAARLEYVSLLAGFALAAVALERRRVLRRHPVLGAGLALALLAVAVRPHAALGYYSGVLQLHVDSSTARWVMVDLFLLALASGVVLVPGAIAALVQPADRRERAFVFLAAAFAGATVLEAALFASNGSDRFQERYLTALLPLVPLAHGLWRRRDGHRRLAVVVVGAGLLLGLAVTPLSGYATGTGLMDSPTLYAVAEVESRLGTADGALVVALLCSLAAALGVALALRRRECVAALAAVSLVALTSAAAWRYDLALNRVARTAYAPTWIDEHALGHVAAIETPGAPDGALLQQMFWNPSVDRELLLQGAQPTDAFAASRLSVGPGGQLRVEGRPLRRPFLFQQYAASASFVGATRVDGRGTFSLWRPAGTPRLRVLALGRYADGWLAWSGRVEVWPAASGARGGVLALTLSLPRGRSAVRLGVAGHGYTVRPGERVPVRVAIRGSAPRTIRFTTRGGAFVDLRPESVRSTMPVLLPLPTGHAARPAALKRAVPRADR